MRKIASIFFTFCMLNVYSQTATLSKKVEVLPADTSSYKVISNSNNIDIDIELRKKINFLRKEQDYIWEPEDGFKILIYRKEE